ncbi:7278_t:CDS:2, partial [Entrophospora sp. SA101]
MVNLIEDDDHEVERCKIVTDELSKFNGTCKDWLLHCSKDEFWNTIKNWKDINNVLEFKPEASGWLELESNAIHKFAYYWNKVLHNSNLSFQPNLKLKLVFSFDEACSLLVKSGQDMPFLLLRRVLQCLPNGIFVVFTDTLSELSNFSPAIVDDHSQRVHHEDLKLFDPFYLFDFIDVFNQHTSEEIDETTNYTKLFFFGRPLWGAYLKSKMDVKDLIMIAQQKLLGGNKIETWQNRIYPTADLAVLSSRLSLSISPQSKIASELVAGHMALCSYVSPDRQRLYIGYSSEPILAEASAILMSDIKNYSHLLKTLCNSVEDGIVDAGFRGELVAKLLLLRAWDKCCNLQIEPMTKYAIPITVKDFLLSLLGEKNYQMAFSDLDENLASGILFFNHFYGLEYTPDKTVLLKMFRRCAAIVGMPGQYGWDLMIPVILKNSVKPENISVINIQIKNQKRQKDSEWPASATTKMKWPEIVESEKDIDYVTPKSEIIKHYSTYSSTRSSRNNQYSVLLFGFTKDTFDCLKDLEKNTISWLQELLIHRTNLMSFKQTEEQK